MFQILLFFLIIISSCYAFADCNGKSDPGKWIGRLKNGNTINIDELHKMVKEFEEYDEFGNINRAQLSGANLAYASMSHWYFEQVRMHNTSLSCANLSRAHFTASSLIESRFDNANLVGTELPFADLTSSSFQKADLREADLSSAKMVGADLNGANLSDANLEMADLTKASLNKADFNGANLSGAKLNDTELIETVLTKSKLSNINLTNAIFEPYPGTISLNSGISTAIGLDSLRYKNSPHSLSELRSLFKKAGLRHQEMMVTYAKRRNDRINLWKNKNILNKIESLFQFIFFEITCAYGMSSGKLLITLFSLIFLFSVPYTFILTRNGSDGIWKVWIPERIRNDLGENTPIQLRYSFIKAVLVGFYFSLLSAFSIGWRDFNVGNWISRLQRREYRLIPTGWARTISGLQSLISVYLLALWVLTYFGNPFER